MNIMITLLKNPNNKINMYAAKGNKSAYKNSKKKTADFGFEPPRELFAITRKERNHFKIMKSLPRLYSTEHRILQEMLI